MVFSFNVAYLKALLIHCNSLLDNEVIGLLFGDGFLEKQIWCPKIIVVMPLLKDSGSILATSMENPHVCRWIGYLSCRNDSHDANMSISTQTST